MGESFAGGPIDPEDPSSLFSNPVASAFAGQNAAGDYESSTDIFAIEGVQTF